MPKTQATVLTSEQLECLSSPVRNAVFMALRTLGQASLAEIGEEVGMAPEAVFYHARTLEKAGLVRLVSRRATTRRPEGVYETVAESFRLPTRAENPDAPALVRRMVSTGLRQVIRAYEQASEAAEAEPQHGKFLSLLRLNARLSDEDFKTFVGMVESAGEFARSRHDPEQGTRIGWSSVVFPAVKKGN